MWFRRRTKTEQTPETDIKREITDSKPEATGQVSVSLKPASRPYRRLSVLNVKGGSGKSTLCTNIAAQLAQKRLHPALEDHDPLCISYQWAIKRPEKLPGIHAINASVSNPKQVTRSWMRHVPEAVDLVVADTPGAFNRLQLQDFLANSHIILIPVADSSIDIESASNFIPQLLEHYLLQDKQNNIGVIANRTSQLNGLRPGFGEYLESLPVDWVASISDHAAYIDAYEQGRGICELDHHRYLDHVAWKRIMQWVEQRMAPPAGRETITRRRVT